MPNPPNLYIAPASTAEAPLCLALVSPDRQRRIAAFSAFARAGSAQIREFSAYPANAEEARTMLGRGFDAVLIDLDSAPNHALHLVEGLCANGSLIVMVFSSNSGAAVMLQALRAGAREFLVVPIHPEAADRALAWVAAQRAASAAPQKPAGRLHVFFGAKGGVGVTTIASNFAVALAEQSAQPSLLLDLNPLLGDAAVNLGLAPDYSLADALEVADQLDAGLLAGFTVRHSSGLDVLASPPELAPVSLGIHGLGKVIAVACRQFAHIILDAGKKIDLRQLQLFQPSATAYLVAQVGIPELRNANRLIQQFSATPGPALQVIINRHQSRFLGVTDEHLARAITVPVRWKIPNDYKAVRTMQTTGLPIVHQDSPIAAVIRQMAADACGSSRPVHTPATRSQSSSLVRLIRPGAAAPHLAAPPVR